MRRWHAPRQAYIPRVWPVFLVSVVASVLVTTVMDTESIWVSAGIGMVMGLVPIQLVYWRWRRKHPVVPLEEVARRSARWN